MCGGTKITKCQKAEYCKWLKTAEGKAAILKLFAENQKLKDLLVAQISSCKKISCGKIFKAIKLKLYKIWKESLV